MTTRTPATAPMMIALVGDTLAHPAVIPTRPARAPFKLMPTSGFPNLIQEVIIARTAPAAAARLVFTAIKDAIFGRLEEEAQRKVRMMKLSTKVLCKNLTLISG